MIRLMLYKSDKAYMPETTAYFEYFSTQPNYDVKIVGYIPNDDECDVFIYPFGFLPFYQKKRYLIVGEYASLSTGRFSQLKNCFKKVFNIKPDIMVCLNEHVKVKMGNTNTLIRGMGYFPNFVSQNAKDIKFDIVYSGANREGLAECILNLASLGFKVCILGDLQLTHCNITSLGRVSLERVYEIYSISSAGLNYIPDIYPYNIQDSTKAIEYVGAGLQVISNRYRWIIDFENQLDENFIYLDEFESDNLVKIKIKIKMRNKSNQISSYQWNNVIKNSKLNEKILSLL